MTEVSGVCSSHGSSAISRQAGGTESTGHGAPKLFYFLACNKAQPVLESEEDANTVVNETARRRGDGARGDGRIGAVTGMLGYMYLRITLRMIPLLGEEEGVISESRTPIMH